MKRLLLCLALFWTSPLMAQDTELPATLIADAIRFDGPTETITATGSVEIFYEDAVLRAGTIRYDGRADTLEVGGPIELIDESGRVIFLAEFAELSSDFQDGVLRSARLVLDRELQIAATEINRSEGRYTQLYQTVASSCEVCEDNPTPLWEIRARRIIHDSETRTLWFEGAQFRAIGVPIAYFPRLRMPDPTRTRAAGILEPEVFGNGTIGTALRIPYFQPLGDHRDLTFSPYATTERFFGTGLRYRQAFARGWIELDGQLSVDDLTVDNLRGYVFGDGFFELPRGFELDLALQAVTDRGYLATYGISDEDRLESHAILARTERDAYFEARITEYNSLRDADNNETLPNTIIDAEWRRVWDAAGGVARLSFTGHSRQRDSVADVIGRDLLRVGTEAGWRGDWVLPAGLLLSAETALTADAFAIQQDSGFDSFQARVSPAAAVELSYPLSRLSQSGVHHLITPTVQFAWSDDGGADVPNGDSAIVAFDEGNLFSLNRFPGGDAIEGDARTAVGFSYTRTDPLGWSLGTTIGRVWRDEDPGLFTAGSGLDGTDSDWLVAVNLSLGNEFSLINRALIDDAFSVTSNETALDWTGASHDLTGTLTWLAADVPAGRPDDTAELFVQAGYDFGSGWRSEADWRYDFAANASTRAGVNLSYATECVDVQFSLSRRFTSSATVAPSTEFGLSVALNGFGASREGRSRDRVCRN